MDLWESFFHELSTFIINIGDREPDATPSFAESIIPRISNYQRVLCAIMTSIQSDVDLRDIFATIIALQKDLEAIQDRWACIEAGVHGFQTSIYTVNRVLPQSGIGRPRVVIEEEKIEFLRELKFSWTQIASIFGVCCRTLYSVRVGYGMVSADRFTRISDMELRHHIERIKQDMPEIGYNMVRGMLRSYGVHVPISRIQQCISDVDPINTALRWATPTYRQRYEVPYPNYVWHIDGNHKLIK